MMNKKELVEYLDKKILLLSGFHSGMCSEFEPVKKLIDMQIKDLRFIIKEIKNLDGAILNEGTVCLETHCECGIKYQINQYCNHCDNDD